MKDIDYKTANDDVRNKYFFHTEPDLRDLKRRNIVCRVCEVIVEPDYSMDRFNSVISVAEQEHVHSDAHQQQVIMQKLAG